MYQKCICFYSTCPFLLSYLVIQNALRNVCGTEKKSDKKKNHKKINSLYLHNIYVQHHPNCFSKKNLIKFTS